MLPPIGSYYTEAGSTVEISGEHGGKATVSFDWFEEENACCDCEVNVYPEEDSGEWWLTWSCEICGDGRAKLYKSMN